MNSKIQRTAIVGLFLTMFCGSLAWAGPTYTGMLASDFDAGNSMGADGLILGNNGWVSSDEPLLLRWNVSWDGSVWHYQYTFNELELTGGLSHFILEVSDCLMPSDIIDPSHPLESGDPQLYSPGDPSNPSLPDDIWGIKLDTGGGGMTVVSFDSSRDPVWGDFYAKDGTKGGAAWNAGFTDPDVDPMAAAANGSIDSHILVPDSTTTVVPAPGAVMLGAAGMALVGWLRRRKALS